MSTLLSLPFEIRTIIWRHTLERDVDLANISEANIREVLTNPNLNLLPACQQINQECSSLTTTYRFILYDFPACEYLHKLLKPAIRQGSQYVVKSRIFMLGGKDTTLTRRHYASELEWAKFRCKIPETSYKSVHFQRNGVFLEIDGMELAMADFLITF
jgi:hypothetical protein